MALTIIFSFMFFLPQNDNFTFKNGNEKIILKIDNNSRNLKWGLNSVLNLKLKNINPSKLNMSASGIKFIKSENVDEINLEINPEKDLFESDTLNLHVSYKNEANENIHHKFEILIKE